VTYSSIRRTGARLNTGAHRNRRLPYFIGTRQTKNQYEKAIKPSMNRTEHQFNRINSTCWFGTPLPERAPQASQYPSSSVAIVRHSQHSFDISRIMPEADRVSHSQ
jgi:hypothetical protein